jgi:hypothetical protein
MKWPSIASTEVPNHRLLGSTSAKPLSGRWALGHSQLVTSRSQLLWSNRPTRRHGKGEAAWEIGVQSSGQPSNNEVWGNKKMDSFFAIVLLVAPGTPASCMIRTASDAVNRASFSSKSPPCVVDAER